MYSQVKASLSQSLSSDDGGGLWKKIGLGAAIVLSSYLLIAIILGIYWSLSLPDTFSVKENAEQLAEERDLNKNVTGFYTVATMIEMAEVLLNKSGGYISNDIFPPGLWLDDIPNWEFGVLVQLRDLGRALRKDLSRSQSQSGEDSDLTIVEPQFNFSNDSWALPSTEGEYRRGLKALYSYMDRLANKKGSKAQFHARADNLRNWLADVETRLGSLSLSLSESVGKKDFTIEGGEITGSSESKTPWTKIDDTFYEARGTAWALIHILKAIEVDFYDVLKDKSALVSLEQIIRELEATQQSVLSPMILNGRGFGMFANHSLVMASYISRANAGIIDLRELLSKG